MIMVYKLRKLFGMHIRASDGEIGKIKDIYFDDHSWTIRYLVVETGGCFDDRQVLISPISVSSIDWDNRLVHVKLTVLQVKASPPIATDKPVSRQHEADHFDHYGYPYYWTDPSIWVRATYPVSPTRSTPVARNSPGIRGEAPLDPQLRSAKEITGYRLQTTAEAMGHVNDFLLDCATWAIRYLVVDCRNWLPAKYVVITPSWIKAVEGEHRILHVEVSPDGVKGAPELHSAAEFPRAHEALLCSHQN
jgi:sporulation protein YlmC with PRC-barrel domain